MKKEHWDLQPAIFYGKIRENQPGRYGETMGNPIEMDVFMVPSGKRLQKTMEHHHV